MRITNYHIDSNDTGIRLIAAVCSDLHSQPFEKILKAFRKISPDIILLAGDIVEVSNEYMSSRNANMVNFFREAANIAPCYYCFGNHEIYFSHTNLEKDRIPDSKMHNEFIDSIKHIGIHLVNDIYEEIETNTRQKCLIGGLVCGRDMNPAIDMPYPDIDFLKKYNSEKGFKILLCHYPHYYEKYLKDTSFDLIVSGHAHGGHWRIFGRGVYAPHQGLFPKYTSGIHYSRFIISRGAVNASKPIPRFFNPTEILRIEIS